MKNHTAQQESSHFQRKIMHRMFPGMYDNEIFRRNLSRLRHAADLSAAELSRRASLNVRAVKDIEEGRAQSPKLSTAFALADALGVDVGELIGLGPRPKIQSDLAEFLSKYDESEQEQILQALSALHGWGPR